MKRVGGPNEDRRFSSGSACLGGSFDTTLVTAIGYTLRGSEYAPNDAGVNDRRGGTRMDRKPWMIALGGCALAAFAIAMFLLGRSSGLAAAAPPKPSFAPTITFAQVPRTFQDLVPPLGPNSQGPGQAQDCKPMVLLYYQGRLYQLQLGPEGQQGQPSSPPEYFPMTPYQGPAIPGLPFPTPPGGNQQAPGLPPVSPRF